ncbi:Domain of unknown function (DUF4390) [Gulbenkiania indica]|uniref:DUF4390 domain-containing protein n=3 Tax=Chromobacteriaceae TaxID=1499392 RepID=A0A0K6GY95_9NEIS|nr:uncharacterized protein DUF4390 [Gulbenkiania mobilis]CUA83717.1 Domain of unknown function (DUF4390) [Gulbenkiania indica]
MACLALPAQADTIASRMAEAELVNGQLAVDTRFGIKLPPSLTEALAQGVTLTFRLEFELTRPRMAAYYLNLRDLFDPHAAIAYKIAYQTLTNRYRVTIGGLSSYYGTLAEALAMVGAIRGWRVLEPGQLAGLGPDEVAGKVRLQLDIAELPKPFQLNALGASDWSLSSGWVGLGIRREPS